MMPPRGLVVTLTEAEVRLADYIGRRRDQVNRAAGVIDRRRDATGEIDRDGFGAELALARILNVYPDLSLSPRQGGGDLLWGGVWVDVKQTGREYGRLIATAWKNGEDVPLYALMTGTMPSFTFRGFAPAHALLAADRLTDLGYGPTYVLPQDALIAGDGETR